MQSPLPVQATQQALFIEQVRPHLAVFDTEMRYLAVSLSGCLRFLFNMAFLFSARVFTPAEVIGRYSQNMPSRWRDFMPVCWQVRN
jgi:hypothetical protein